MRLNRLKIAIRQTALAFMILLILFLTLNVYIFKTTTVCDDAYIASFLDKREMMKTTPSPKIVLLGDSSYAYGIHSQLIEEHFNLPIVNTGVNGTMGMAMWIKIFEPYIHEGDIVLLSSSYKQWGNDPQTGIQFYGFLPSNTIFELLLLDPTLVQYVSHSQQTGDIVYDYTLTFGRRIQNGLFAPPNCIHSSPHLSRSGFNIHGDYIGHLNKPNLAKDFSTVELNLSDISPDIIAELNSFAERIRARGASIYFILPPLAQSAYENNQEDVDNFIPFIREQLDFPVLGELNTFVYSDNLMYDTEFHMHTEGRDIRTNDLIEALSSALNTSPSD